MIKLATARRAATALVVVTLVAAVGMGAFASSARTDASPTSALANFHAFIPGIASDSGGTAQPSTPSPLVSVQNVSTWVPGGLWVYGEVHNGLSTTISNVTVTATGLDSNGAVVISRTAPIAIDQVGAGSNGPFRILLAGALDPTYTFQTAVAGYQISATPSLNDQLTDTAAGPRPWEIQTPDTVNHKLITTVSTDLEAIDGTITNNSAQTITSPSVFVAIYDGSGKLAMTSSTSAVSAQYQDTGTVALSPGGTGSYTVTVPIPDYYQIHGPVRMVVYLAPTPAPPGP